MARTIGHTEPRSDGYKRILAEKQARRYGKRADVRQALRRVAEGARARRG